MPSLRPLLTCLLPVLLSAAASALADPAGPHRYHFTVAEDLSRMWVEARFSSPVAAVRAASGDAGDFLLGVKDCRDEPRQTTIRLRNRRMMLPAGGVLCMNYSVDLAAAAATVRHNAVLADGMKIVSPALWLWRPKLSREAAMHLSFELPPGMRVAVPWQRSGAESRQFRLGHSPENAHAPAVFGRFDYREIEVPGAVLRVSLLESADPAHQVMDNDSIVRWLQTTAGDMSLAYGRFPNPSPQIVVIPAGGGRKGSAVPFGRVVRDGGEAVELFVDRTQALDAYLRDWTATHEFSHLMLPYVGRRHRWVSEGFAQYYQNILLARAGTYAPLTAWQKLYEGLERGRLSRPELSPNEVSARAADNGRMKIYWSGAAIALMADVELRERSGGRVTLDDVMGRLQACCLPSMRTWSGPELFGTLDELAGMDVFMPLYRRYADTAGFPDTGPLFERLGLTVADRTLRVRRGGELQHIRSAITGWDSRTVAGERPPAGGGLAARPAAGTAGSR